MARSNFENLDVYRLAEDVADRVWAIAESWKTFASRYCWQSSSFVLSDSIGANIAEGSRSRYVSRQL